MRLYQYFFEIILFLKSIQFNKFIFVIMIPNNSNQYSPPMNVNNQNINELNKILQDTKNEMNDDVNNNVSQNTDQLKQINQFPFPFPFGDHASLIQNPNEIKNWGFIPCYSFIPWPMNIPFPSNSTHSESINQETSWPFYQQLPNQLFMNINNNQFNNNSTAKENNISNPYPNGFNGFNNQKLNNFHNKDNKNSEEIVIDHIHNFNKKNRNTEEIVIDNFENMGLRFANNTTHNKNNSNKKLTGGYLETDLCDDISKTKVVWKGEMFSYQSLLENKLLNISEIPKRNVMIYWDLENVVPSSFNMDHNQLTKAILKFGQKHGFVHSFKAFANERFATIKSEIMNNSDVELIITPSIYSGSERADNEIIVDMMLNTGKIGNMKKGDIFILITMDADFVVPISILRKNNYNVILLVPPQNDIKRILFDAPNEFYAIGDEGFYKVEAYSKHKKLVQLASERKNIELSKKKHKGIKVQGLKKITESPKLVD